MKIKHLLPGKYVLAVSGGVDSIVLLDLLCKQTDIDLVVAHFNHGIRPESHLDAEFVASLAQDKKLPFEAGEGNLGPDASEDSARRARYRFLRSVQAKHNAAAIVTAHHQDDVIETALINLIRGTGRRGLHALGNRAGLVRPLIDTTKAQILDYALQQKLKWREDATNTDTKYLRNYIRLELIPRLQSSDPQWRERMLEHIAKSRDFDATIDTDLNRLYRLLVSDQNRTEVQIDRTAFIRLPASVGKELLVEVLKRLPVAGNIDRPAVKKAYNFIKTAKAGKRFSISKHSEIKLADNGYVLVTTKT